MEIILDNNFNEYEVLENNAFYFEKKNMYEKEEEEELCVTIRNIRNGEIYEITKSQFCEFQSNWKKRRAIEIEREAIEERERIKIEKQRELDLIERIKKELKSTASIQYDRILKRRVQSKPMTLKSLINRRKSK